MNFALIVDKCKVASYYVKDNKAYKFAGHKTDIPYEFHHSVNNECFMGYWGYPFVFNGCFLNWSEWKELPKLDLDVIFVSIESQFDKCRISDLRKKYPNATIIGYPKESWNWEQTWRQRIDVLNQCDKVIILLENYSTLSGLQEFCTKKIEWLPQPVNIDYLYNNFYKEERHDSIFAYDITWNNPRRGSTLKFAQYLANKYNIELVHVNTQNEKNQWHEFLKHWTNSTFHINCDPVSTFVGQQATQCAALGVIQIGGVNESHFKLFPDTATNDFGILESKFEEYLNNYDSRVSAMQYAYTKATQIYSYDAVRTKLKKILKTL